MSTDTTRHADPEAQERYWQLAKARNDAAANLERAEHALAAFAADYPGVTFRAFRPEHIDRAFSDSVETWEL